MGSETKWTPGPWWIEAETGDVVAKDGDWEICTFTRGDSHHEADAHLIAAAPELAEVARKLIEDYEAWQRDDISPHEIGDIVDEARDAYAKARGEQS